MHEKMTATDVYKIAHLDKKISAYVLYIETQVSIFNKTLYIKKREKIQNKKRDFYRNFKLSTKHKYTSKNIIFCVCL